MVCYNYWKYNKSVKKIFTTLNIKPNIMLSSLGKSVEPLEPAADPYPQMNGIADPKILDKLVGDTASYFFKRESLLIGKE